MEQQQLSVQEASEQLQELDRQLRKRAITEIVYRNRKEKILASITRTNDTTQPRYTTRRQLRALAPAPERPAKMTPVQSLDPLTEKNKLPQRQYQPTRLLMQELDDFIVSDDDESQLLSSYYDSGDETEEALISSDDGGKDDDDVDRLVEKVVQRINVSSVVAVTPPVAPVIKEVPVLLTDKEREEKERAEHFASVTVKFNPQYRPMFPPKGPKTLEIDFGTNKG